MDRGRCGYDLVSNKFLREQALSHKRDVHLDRLKKIKNRSPGSSSTLDNTIPESLKSKRISNNPRKKSKANEKNIAIERQNKVLLQRISNILTAPPKITDKEYQDMKKLIGSINQSDKFTSSINEKRNKEFFDRVHKTGPYYKHQVWEEDYKKQKHGQKFMRQVTYERPKDWVDPFAPVPKEEPPKRGLNRDRTTLSSTAGNRKSTSASGSHVNRVKSLREDNRGDTVPDTESDGSHKSNVASRQSSIQWERNERNKEDSEESLPSRLLASIERVISVTTIAPEIDEIVRPSTGYDRFGATGSRKSFNSTSASLPSLNSHTAEGFDTNPGGLKEVNVSIFCSLVDDRVLFITIDSVDDEIPLHAEAQIDCNELMIVDVGDSNAPPPSFPSDPETQESLAFDLINEITLCVDAGSEDYEIVLPDPGRLLEDGHSEASVKNEVTMEEALRILEVFDPVNYSCGISLPVEFIYPQTSATTGVTKPLARQRTTLTIKNEMKDLKPEKLHTLLKIRRTGEEMALVRAHIVRDSVNHINSKHPVIPADTVMELAISLPSILAIESELVLDYFRNAALNIRIQHNTATMQNVLLLGEE